MAEGFTCAVNERYRSVCKHLPKYSGSRYCVLHEPDEEKDKEEFEKVRDDKLAQNDYDFGGTIFPKGTSNFEGAKFDSYACFAKTSFLGDANFSEAQFSGGTDFSGATFNEGVSFSGAHFSGSTTFIGVQFKSGTTSFQDAQFSGVSTLFWGAKFSGTWILFSRAQFDNNWITDFQNAQFSSRTLTDFGQVQFKGGTTSFSKAEFGGEGVIQFLETHFSSERTDFSRARFSDAYSTFARAQFSGKQTTFSTAQFSGETTDFQYTQFSSQSTDFSEATFNGQPRFDHTTFRAATFENTTFQRGADFTGAIFDGTTSLSNGTRKRTTDFRRAIFGGELYFRGAEFKGFTDFYRTTFLDAVKFIGGESEEGPSPLFAREGQVSFKRARIDKPELFSFDTLLLRPSWFVGVDARKFDFTAVQWYGLFNSNGSEATFDEAFDKEIKGIREKGETGSPYNLLAQACRRLSANAEDNREYPLANEFHYWSMDALRKRSWSRLKGLTPNSLTKKETWHDIREHFGLITTLYWALSGYGVRAARAFWILVAIWAAFTTLYVLVDPSEFKDFGQGMGYRWQAAVYSLLALARLNPEPRPEEPGVFQFLVGLEGILGPLQIALLALAIRRKVMR